MPMQDEPIVGALYEDTDGLRFEVTDFDVDEGTIDVRYDDGSAGEIDIDAWYELELRQYKPDRSRPDGEIDDEDDEEERPVRATDDDEDDDLDEDYNDEEEEQ